MLKNGKLLLAVFAIIPILLFSGCTDKGYVADKISVLGTSVGGMSREEAVNCLSAITLDKNERVSVNVEGKVVVLTAEEVGAVYDMEKTADYLLEKSEGIFSGWFKKEYNPVVSIDMAKLDAAISEKLSGTEWEVSEIQLSIVDEGIMVVNGISGRKVDREKLSEMMEERFGESERGEIEISYTLTPPQPTDYDALLEDFSGTFKEAEYIMDENGNITVTEDCPGVIFDKASAINQMKQRSEEGESYIIPCEVQLSTYTKEYLEDCLFRDMLGTYSTNFSTSSANRSSNVALAAQSVGNTILMPGEEFSFNATLGERTVANGYKVAGAYVGGKTVDQVGGGICQVSSTLYNTVLLSNLEIVERRSHQMTVSYVPLGRDATVNWGTTDFRFKNNTDFPVKITSEVYNKNVRLSIIGTETVEGKEIKIETSTVSVTAPTDEYVEDDTMPVGETKTEKGHTGYVVDAVRVVYSSGQEVSREKLTRSKYAATNNIITVGTMVTETPTEEAAADEMPSWLIPSNSDTGL